jgi:hypothetical protein
MANWSVIVNGLPSGKTYDFYRVWRKHRHMELSDEEILEKLHDFEVSSSRAATKKADQPEIKIAEYRHKETAENALKEVTNLGGTGRVEEATV